MVAIVQARVASNRLPGKVLADIEGETMLTRVVERAGRASSLDQIAVATTTDVDDDPLFASCESKGHLCLRGSTMDVLDRVYRAARTLEADIVVRLTADCPLIDGEVIDQTVSAFVHADPPVDFAANRLPDDKSFPVGTDTEVCSIAALEQAWTQAEEPYQREHVMPYLYEEPERFRTLLVKSETDYSAYRWTVDTAEDLELVRQVYAHFGGRDNFTYRELLDLFATRPELARINLNVEHKTQYDLDPDWRRKFRC